MRRIAAPPGCGSVARDAAGGPGATTGGRAPAVASGTPSIPAAFVLNASINGHRPSAYRANSGLRTRIGMLRVRLGRAAFRAAVRFARNYVLPAIHLGTVERSARFDDGGRILAWDHRIHRAPTGDPGAHRHRRARPAALRFCLPAPEIGRVQSRGDEIRDGRAAEFVASHPARAQVGNADRDGALFNCGG